MLKGSLNRDFSLFSDAEFETRGLHITISMTGNPLFPALQDRMPEIKTAQEKYSADLASSRALGKQLVAEKNKSRFALSFLLGNLALLVMAQTNDAAELLTTGFVLRKQPEPTQITSPGNVTLSTGLNPGEINLYVSRPKGAEGFLHQISDTTGAEEKIWISTASTSCKHVFSNLQPGKLYAVRTAAVGSKGQIAYSTIGTMYAQ
jgi:hypothetical protein